MRSHAKDASAPSTHRENATFSLGVFAAMLVCAVAFLGIGASAAGAATAGLSYGYTKDIGTPDGGQLSGIFTNVVAVSNDDGNVFIARQGSPAVDVIDPATDASISRPSIGGIFPRGVAVSADGKVFYVADGLLPGPPQKWVRSGTSPLTYTQDSSWTPAISSPTGMAVDPTTGDLIVGNAGTVVRLDPVSGAVLSSFDGSNTALGAFQGVQSIAVAPNRDIYVVDYPGRVERFAADGSWIGSLPLPTTQFLPSGIAVDPQNSDVAVEMPAGEGLGPDPTIRIYTAANTLKDVIRVPPSLVTIDPNDGKLNNVGLAFSPDGSKLYVGLKDGSAHVYTRGTQPGVDAPVVSNITPTGAHVSANVATGGDSTLARIEYCLASDPCEGNLTSEGASPWQRLPDHTFSSPESGGDISDDLSGLLPNEHYLLRTYAIDETNQIENHSSITSFNTGIPAPLVTTGPIVGVTDTTVRLSGSVDNTFGDQTTYHFAYGTDESYGSQIPVVDGIAGNLRTQRSFTQLLKGLQPGTEYHYAIVATNSGGTTVGSDRTFKTLAADEVAPVRGYEQVTPVDKKGLSLLADWGFQSSSDGSAFEFAASSPASDAESHVIVSRYASRRESGEWIGAQPLDPPFITSRTLINSVTLGVSDDFEHALVVSQYALTPDATQGAANIYIRDLSTDAFRLVATATEHGAFNALTGTSQLDAFKAGAPDFSWVVLKTKHRLLPGAPQTAIYKWTSSAGLSLISLLPDGTVPAGSSAGMPGGRRAVTDDGETFAFTLLDEDAGVYRRSGDQTEAVSVSEVNDGSLGNVQPANLDGMTGDGRFVFFNTGSQLTEDDTDGGVSEYRYDASAQQLEYLAPQDGTGGGDTQGFAEDGKTVYLNSNSHLVAWREGQTEVVLSPGPARTNSFGYRSPDGQYFEFVGSDGAVHLYSAATGETVCLTCTAAGKPLEGHLPFPDINISNRYQQTVTDSGAAYFYTPAPLLGVDHNGTNDVYEYLNGRLTLISPGDRDFNAYLADISEDGSDVFFTTAQGLVSQDTDQAYDVYDARVGGGLPGQNPLPPISPCAGADCGAGASAPPADPNLGSSSGLPGNQGKKHARSHKARKCRKANKGKKGTKCHKPHKARRGARSTNSNAGGAK